MDFPDFQMSLAEPSTALVSNVSVLLSCNVGHVFHMMHSLHPSMNPALQVLGSYKNKIWGLHLAPHFLNVAAANSLLPFIASSWCREMESIRVPPPGFHHSTLS